MTEMPIHRSRILIMLLFSIYGGAMVCIFLLPFPLLLRLMLASFCFGAFFYQWQHRVLFNGKKVVTAITYYAREKNAQWILHTKHDHYFKAILQKSSVVLPYVAILHFKLCDEEASCGRFRKLKGAFLVTVLIFCDAMLKDDFRKLRVFALTARNKN